MNCKKCGNNLFYIITESNCKDCVHNGAYSGITEDYIYDQESIDRENIERDEAFENGNCEIGECFGAGCHIYKCSKCENLDIFPVIEE